MIAKSDQSVEEKYRFLNELARKRGKTTVVSYGPILMMELGHDWIDRGVHVIGGRPVWHNFRLEEPRCTLRVYRMPVSNSQKKADSVHALVSSTAGPVPEDKWQDLRYIFGMSGNPKYFTIESVEVTELGGKKVIAMTGKHTEDGSLRKGIYVSLSGDWKESYEFGIGTTSDKENFDKAVTRFDQALKTVRWKDSI